MIIYSYIKHIHENIRPTKVESRIQAMSVDIIKCWIHSTSIKEESTADVKWKELCLNNIFHNFLY